MNADRRVGHAIDTRQVSRRDMLPVILAVIGTICGLLPYERALAAPVQRAPTLEDALAIKRFGSLSLHPSGRWVAAELSGSIRVFSTKTGDVEIEIPSGTSPLWSPDGTRLAYYADVAGYRQLHIYEWISGRTSQITRLHEGISPNPFIWVVGDSGSYTWSPDSSRIALVTRFTGHSSEAQPVRLPSSRPGWNDALFCRTGRHLPNRFVGCLFPPQPGLEAATHACDRGGTIERA